MEIIYFLKEIRPIVHKVNKFLLLKPLVDKCSHSEGMQEFGRDYLDPLTNVDDKNKSTLYFIF